MCDMNKDNKGTWKKDLRLYVHVPFCVKKCNYCDFLSDRANDLQINSYFDALYKEIRSYKGRADDYRITSVFIGGGTPSYVPSEKIVRTLKELKNVFDFDDKPEITIEVNPGTVDMDYQKADTVSSHIVNSNKLLDYKEAGINRISFGLQSTHDHELKLLGRIHTYSQFEENYKMARALGFNNINVDLMSALPGQDITSWEENLYRIVALRPEHISAYSLIIEEGTPFYKLYGPEGTKRHDLPSEELDREIYARTKEILASFGYERYEISNYALKGYECKHNIGYWERDNYLGLGLGSASLIENIRFSNTDNLQEYIKLIKSKEINESKDINYFIGSIGYKGNNDFKEINNIRDENNNKNIIDFKEIHKTPELSILDDFFGIRRDVIHLSVKEQMEEFMFLGLRKTGGISRQAFYKIFNVSIDDIYGKILDKLTKQGLISTDNDMIKLTDFGLDVSNTVFAEFLLE